MDIVTLTSGVVLDCLVGQSDQDSKMQVTGRVVAVYIEPHINCMSAPTVKITTKGPPVQTILEVATDIAGWWYPVTPIHLNTTGDAIANLYSEGVPVHDYVNVDLSDAESGDYVNVYLLLE